MVLGAPNTSQLHGDNHSRFSLGSQLQPPTPKWSLCPWHGTKQLLQLKWSGASTKIRHKQKIPNNRDDAVPPGNFLRDLHCTWHYAMHTATLEEVSCALSDNFINYRTKTEQWQQKTPWTMLQKVFSWFSLLDVNAMEVLLWHKVPVSKQDCLQQ